jgi:hypothetical protein
MSASGRVGCGRVALGPDSIPFVCDGCGTFDVAHYCDNINCMLSYWAVVTTVAGSGIPSFFDGTGSQAGFNAPWDVAVDASSNVYVVAYNAPRKINPAGGAHAFVHFCTCDAV